MTVARHYLQWQALNHRATRRTRGIHARVGLPEIELLADLAATHQAGVRCRRAGPYSLSDRNPVSLPVIVARRRLAAVQSGRLRRAVGEAGNLRDRERPPEEVGVVRGARSRRRSVAREGNLADR